MADGSRCGRYQIVEPIGVGGMAEVLLALGPTATGAVGHFALKRLLPQLAEEHDAVRMFEDEARLAAHLDHPSICVVHGLEHDGPVPFQVMEWVDGVTLRWLVDRSQSTGGLPLDVVARIGIDVADALDHAHLARDASGHALGVVHRDVSPPNVMITFDGVVKLLDFGLAKARTQLQKTRPGFVKGKFGYLAPEQLRGLVDPRTDVFQLGLCLYEALTGEQLFRAHTAADAVREIATHRGMPSVRQRRPDVPEAMEAVVARALEPDPDRRYHNASEMRDALIAATLEHDADASRMAMVVDMLLPRDGYRPPPEEQAPAPPPPDAAPPPIEQVKAMAADAVDAPEEAGGGRRIAGWILFAVLTAAAGFAAAAAYLEYG